MSLQNRVTPFGALKATPARGAWLGNRGILHDEHRRIVAQWRTKAWITCVLRLPGVHRAVFSPHTWSELFFLDEATAFAAGHRPCGYCRRERYLEFKRGWCAANRGLIDVPDPRVAAIDAVLQRERVARDGTKVTWAGRCERLPDGTFIARDGAACLVWRGHLWPWSHFGYGDPIALPACERVAVLTPKSIVRLFRGGFTPQVDASAGAAHADARVRTR